MNEMLIPLLAAVPGIAAVAWLAFVAYAKRSEAKWDDVLVEFVEDIASSVASKTAKEEVEKAVGPASAE